MVAIKLDNSEETYFLQKAQLIGVSSYFSAALEGTFKESTERVMKLPGCEKDAFELFLYSLCYRKLPNLADYIDHKDDDAVIDSRASQVQVALVQLWCFADAILTPDLQNIVMKSLLQFFAVTRITTEGLRVAFSLTSKDSLLRKAMLDEFLSDYAAEKRFPSSSNLYTEEEKDSFARIPGLMSELASGLMSCGWRELKGALINDQSVYVVT